MSVYKSIMKGLDEAIKYQEGKIDARKRRISINPVEKFDKDQIKQIRTSLGLSQVSFASTLGVSKKTVEAWESGRNIPNGSSSKLLQIFRDNPEVITQYISQAPIFTISDKTFILLREASYTP